MNRHWRCEEISNSNRFCSTSTFQARKTNFISRSPPRLLPSDIEPAAIFPYIGRLTPNRNGSTLPSHHLTPGESPGAKSPAKRPSCQGDSFKASSSVTSHLNTPHGGKLI